MAPHLPGMDPDLKAGLVARLLHDVPRMLAFLQQVDAHAEVLYNPHVLKLAVARYELMWLPMASQQEAVLVAPIDIAFIWHCHLLAPLRFAPASLALQRTCDVSGNPRTALKARMPTRFSA